MGAYSTKSFICIECNAIHYRWGKFCGSCYNRSLKLKSKNYLKCLKEYNKKRLEKYRLKNRKEKKCEICHKQFLTGYNHQIRCKKCTKKRLPIIDRKCIICKKSFSIIRSKQFHCSKKCYAKYYYTIRDINKRRLYNRIREAQERGAKGKYTIVEWEKLKKDNNYTCMICKQQEPEIKQI